MNIRQSQMRFSTVVLSNGIGCWISRLFQVITWLSDLILSQLELVSKQSEVIQINSIMACQSEQLQRQQKLIASLLKCLREEHLVLKGWDKVTSSLQSQFDSICRLLESGGRELGWADQQIDEDNINQSELVFVDPLTALFVRFFLSQHW